MVRVSGHLPRRTEGCRRIVRCDTSRAKVRSAWDRPGPRCLPRARSRRAQGPGHVNANLSILSVSVDTSPTTTTRALKRSPAALDDVRLRVLEDLTVEDERVRAVTGEPVARRDRPLGMDDFARTVLVDERRLPYGRLPPSVGRPNRFPNVSFGLAWLWCLDAPTAWPTPDLRPLTQIAQSARVGAA